MHKAHKNSKRFLGSFTISQAVTTSSTEEELAVGVCKAHGIERYLRVSDTHKQLSKISLRNKEKRTRSYSMLDEMECFFQSFLFGVLIIFVCFLVEICYIFSNLWAQK